MHCTGCLERILTGYHVSIPSEVVVISNFHFMLRLRRLRTQVRPEIASEQTVGAGRLGRAATTQYLHPSTAWIVKSGVYTPASHHPSPISMELCWSCLNLSHSSLAASISQYEAASLYYVDW